MYIPYIYIYEVEFFEMSALILFCVKFLQTISNSEKGKTCNTLLFINSTFPSKSLLLKSVSQMLSVTHNGIKIDQTDTVHP